MNPAILKRRRVLVLSLILVILVLLNILGAEIQANSTSDGLDSNTHIATNSRSEASKHKTNKADNFDSFQSFVATAYGPPWDEMQGTGITSLGIPLNGVACVIAVDPSVIPYRSLVEISPDPHPECDRYQALDTGGAIVGSRIDFYDWRGREHQYAWGKRDVRLRIIK